MLEYERLSRLWPIVAHCGPVVRLLLPLKGFCQSCARGSIHCLDKQEYPSFTQALFVNGLSSYQLCRFPHFIFINSHTSLAVHTLSTQDPLACETSIAQLCLLALGRPGVVALIAVAKRQSQKGQSHRVVIKNGVTERAVTKQLQRKLVIIYARGCQHPAQG